MSQVVSERVVELLDRKYDFVINSSLKTFMLDLKQFLEFLTEDELIKDFTAKLTNEVVHRAQDYANQLQKEKLMAIEIKEALLEKHPELDDTNLPPPNVLGSFHEYEYSFANFNGVVERSQRTGRPLESELLDDKSDVFILLNILHVKINIYQGEDGQGQPTKIMEEEIRFKLSDLDNIHKHTHLDWVNFCRISPGIILYSLQEAIKRINPEPEDQTAWRQMTLVEKLNHATDIYFSERGYEWITDATYGVISKYSNYSPSNLSNDKLEEIISNRKRDLKRVYEAVRQEIGITRLHLQLLDRYRIRCQWYNQAYLRSQVIDDEQKFKSNREDILTRDLALYLYDQGITVLYRPRLGKHEIDLVELDARHPIFIEAKAYKDSSAKAELISGISQLHAYLSNYEAYKNIIEAFYVVFRLGGPIYEFPFRITTNRFTIYPLLIDLGLSRESGRKQAKPIIISEEEIMKQIEVVDTTTH